MMPLLIGEAATYIPDNIRNSNQEIPWRQLIATRNRLIHGYLGNYFSFLSYLSAYLKNSTLHS